MREVQTLVFRRIDETEKKKIKASLDRLILSTAPETVALLIKKKV